LGTSFSARSDRPLGPPSFLYNGYRVFPGGRGGRGVGLTLPPHLVPKVLEKSRTTRLLTLKACVAYEKGENLPYLRMSDERQSAVNRIELYPAVVNMFVLYASFSQQTALRISLIHTHIYIGINMWINERCCAICC